MQISVLHFHIPVLQVHSKQMPVLFMQTNGTVCCETTEDQGCQVLYFCSRTFSPTQENEEKKKDCSLCT